MSERSEERGRTVYYSVLAAMLTSAATTYGLRALESPPGTEASPESETVEVPAVQGLEQATAQELLRSRGLRVMVLAEEPSAEHPAGRVARQEPLAGSEVATDSAVNIAISTGPPQVSVPNVVGQPMADAQRRLRAAGLSAGEVDESGEGEPPGTITAQQPAPGTEVDRGSTIALTSTPAGIEVPEVEGTPYRRAREAIEEAGLTVGAVRRRWNEGLPEFIVRDQEPEAGTVVAPGSEVAITIND